MDFGLSEEQVALQDSVNRYLDEQAGLEQLKGFAKGADSTQLWEGLAELGVTSLLFDDETGGLGLKILDAALVAECLGAHATPAPFIGSAVLAPLAAARSDNPSAFDINGLLSGESTLGVAISEIAGARGDAGVRASNGKLSGRSLFVLDPQASQVLVTTADKSLYLVDSGAQGLEQLSHTTIDRTRDSGELRFTDTPARLVSENPTMADDLLDVARTMLVADTLGAAQHMLDTAVAYAKQRTQFNRVIGSFQAVKHLCAEMTAELEPCRAMMWYAAYALDELPDEARITACHAKAHMAEVGTFVARTATEVHGGVGFTDLLGLHYWFKRIGFNRQALGAPEIVREQAAQVQGLVA
ncbi:MAG: acyl-CoA dehydrogenase family protein [Gammaproteobacteria bacterium]